MSVKNKTEDKYSGQVLDGRYELEKLIGEGGMANVYRAKDLKDNRVVAVKILREEFKNNQELVRRFKNESRAISILNHPNIVKVFDVNVSDDIQYIVMEYIDGITLKMYMRQRGEPLTYKETLHFTTQILHALEHAHKKGIVHRDVKPQNIMITGDSNVKMMDFGIARLSRGESYTVTDQAIGSVHYISPEQAKGENTDARSDIYSLGIMMYEMLSGHLPFDSDTAVSIAIKQISDKAVPLREVNPSVPPALAAITEKAMSKAPENRYDSAIDMLRDLNTFRKQPNAKVATQRPSNVPAVAKGTNNNMSNAKSANAKKNTAKPKKSLKKTLGKKNVGFLVPVTTGIALAVLVVSFLLVFSIFKNSGNFILANTSTIQSPDYIGKTESEVKEISSSADYKNLNVVIERVWRPDQGEETDGKIISQLPSADKEIKANQTVTLQLNELTSKVSVPSVSGMTRDEATKELQKLNLSPLLVPKTNPGVDENLVIETSPSNGEQVQVGSQVKVYFAYGESDKSGMATVPSLIGKTQAQATTSLNKANLNLGTVEEVFDDNAKSGTIISQGTTAGERVKAWSTISIKVSKGPSDGVVRRSEDDDDDDNVINNSVTDKDSVQLTNVIGQDIEYATSALTAQGFTVLSEQKMGFPPANRVVSMTPSANSYQKVGTSITLQYSDGKAVTQTIDE